MAYLKPIQSTFPGSGTTGSTSATFTVSLNAATTAPVTVKFATTDGTAKAGVVYVAQSGTLTFNPGDTTKTVTVPLLADPSASANLNFVLKLTDPSGATLSTSTGTATITH